MKNTFIKSIRSLKTIGILFLAFFLLCPSVYSSPLAMNKHDFAIKGFHIDLRCEVNDNARPQRNFAKELAEFGIKYIIMEWEGSYPYDKHATISNKICLFPRRGPVIRLLLFNARH